MLAPRHFATMREQMAIDATLARLELELLLEAAPRYGGRCRAHAHICGQIRPRAGRATHACVSGTASRCAGPAL